MHTSLLRCAFTGYRPQKMPFGFDESDPRCVDFRRRLRTALVDLIGEGYAHFLSGGALGMDLFASETVLELKALYPWITLEVAVPFDGQADRWEAAQRARREAVLRAADRVTCTGHAYTRDCMLRRNRYLVGHADLLLAAWDGQPGGTQMTVRMAQAAGIRVQLLPPTA